MGDINYADVFSTFNEALLYAAPLAIYWAIATKVVSIIVMAISGRSGKVV